MNFTAAMKVLLAGGLVSLNGTTYRIAVGGFGLVDTATDDDVSITTALLDATTYANAAPAIPVLTADEVYAVFNEDKGRWVSTTEVAKHKAAGRRVAVFHLDQLI